MSPEVPSFPALSVGQVAAMVGGEVEGEASLALAGLGTIETSAPGQLIFISNEKYAPLWERCPAAAALVSRKIAPRLPARANAAVIKVDDADIAFAEVLRLCQPPPPAAGLTAFGVHPTAVVDSTAQLGEGVRIGAHCVIGPRVVIGPRTVLYPAVTVFDDARLGADDVLWSGVVVRERCVVGDRCILHANVVVGADGFGYRPVPDGSGVVKIPHIGTVEIGHDVEIGANTCIDRGKLAATVIGDHCKIDNLCQIGHNSRLGRGVIVCGKVGISGSVTIGDGAVIGGGAGVSDHVTIGAGAAVAAAAGVMRDVPAGVRVSGIPAREIKQFFREQAAIARLPGMVRPPRIVAAGQNPGVAPPRRQTFQEWLDELNATADRPIVVRDYDGLDRANLEKSLRGTLMTEQEFQQRLSRCTYNIRG